MKGKNRMRKNKGPLAFYCCVNESHFVFSVSVLLPSLSLCVCIGFFLSRLFPSLAQAFLFLMENKDQRVAKIGVPNEKHGVSDLRPRLVYLGPKA